MERTTEMPGRIEVSFELIRQPSGALTHGDLGPWKDFTVMPTAKLRVVGDSAEMRETIESICFQFSIERS